MTTLPLILILTLLLRGHGTGESGKRAMSTPIAPPSNLVGTYKLVQLEQLFDVKHEDPPFLRSLCPPNLTLSPSLAGSKVELSIEYQPPQRHCHTRNQALSLSRATIATSGGATQLSMSLTDVERFFPLLTSAVHLDCGGFTANDAKVVIQDIGYWFTLLNHYRVTGSKVGGSFNETSLNSLSGMRGAYWVNLAVDYERGWGCAYMKSTDWGGVLAEREAVGDGGMRAECFPANAQVWSKSGAMRMEDVHIGEEIWDGEDWSEVVLLSHSEHGVRRRFVRISGGNAIVTASRGHYIELANGNIKPMIHAKRGDIMRTVQSDGDRLFRSRNTSIDNVEETWMEGLYNPHTKSGRLAVWDAHSTPPHTPGVVMSAYTTAVDVRVARMGVWVVQWLGRGVGNVVSRGLREGKRGLKV